MGLAARVGEHHEHVGGRVGVVRGAGLRVGHLPGVLLRPDRLPAGLDLLRVVAVVGHRRAEVSDGRRVAAGAAGIVGRWRHASSGSGATCASATTRRWRRRWPPASRWSRCSASTTACSPDRARRARAPSSCSSAWPISTGRWRRGASGLVVRRGPPERELVELARATGAAEIHFTRDATPFARERGRRMAAACGAAGLRLVGHAGLCAVDDVGGDAHGGGDAVPRVHALSPAWLERRAPAGARRAASAVPAPERRSTGAGSPCWPSSASSQEITTPPPGGERAAGRAVGAFRAGALAGYAARRPRRPGGARGDLAPVAVPALRLRLAAGSRGRRCGDEPRPRRSDASCAGGTSTSTCSATTRRTRARGPGALPGRSRGGTRRRTSSAGRRAGPATRWSTRACASSRREGWMHNRARLVVGSFLTKHLGIDWREGERWFMRLLLDGDPAVNNGNWQWIASVGVRPAAGRPAPVQPDPPAGALRPATGLRPPLGARAAPRAGRVPGRAVADARRPRGSSAAA